MFVHYSVSCEMCVDWTWMGIWEYMVGGIHSVSSVLMYEVYGVEWSSSTINTNQLACMEWLHVLHIDDARNTSYAKKRNGRLRRKEEWGNGVFSSNPSRSTMCKPCMCWKEIWITGIGSISAFHDGRFGVRNWPILPIEPWKGHYGHATKPQSSRGREIIVFQTDIALISGIFLHQSRSWKLLLETLPTLHRLVLPSVLPLSFS